MKLPRRNFLRLDSGHAALPAFTRLASAQAYPSRAGAHDRRLFGRQRARHRRASDRGNALSDLLGQPSWSRTGPAPAATSAPKPSSRAPARLHAADDGRLTERDQRDALRTSSASISSATSTQVAGVANAA